MIALDSSILVRYLVQDDPEQGRIAADFVEGRLSAEQPGYVSTIVLIETIWVLRSRYALSMEDVASTVSGLLSARQLRVEQRGLVESLLLAGPKHLADRIIHALASRAGCSETVTFDHRFARLPGVRLLES